MNMTRIGIALLSLCILLAACGQDQSAAPEAAPAAPAKETPAAPAPEPEATPSEAAAPATPAPAEASYLLGRGKADVTGPALGVQMWGFVREDQLTEGIHTRLFSRAYVIAEKDSPEDRVLFVSVDIGSITHDMQLEVVELLQAKYGDTYTMDNTILSATHTHSGPAGYWHWGTGTPLGSSLIEAHFDAIVDGVVRSIAQAHDDLQPGSLYFDQGIVEGAGANRSMVAYEANPPEERAKYDSPTDKTMSLIKLVAEDGSPMGVINWFASHPTAMTYNNHLISGDHKGHASMFFESEMDADFVAAFAQTNCGDVSPNLNLDNTGPGEDQFDTTRIIGERQLDVALTLFNNADRDISGEIESKQIYVNFAYLPVDGAYTNGAGMQRTCPSALGYSLAAGSTEDGGGHAMFKEGMLHRNAMIEGLVKRMYNLKDPSDECRECHGVKPILFPTGEQDPPIQTQVLPLTLTRIGPLALASVAAEVTTMAGRRLRGTIAAALEIPESDVIIVGYANHYGGYLTTREEYNTQQYEGGHTIYGPWSMAAYQQEFDRMARSMKAGRDIPSKGTPRDMREIAEKGSLDGETIAPPRGANLGDVVQAPEAAYGVGDTAETHFYALDPRVNFPQPKPFIAVEQQNGDDWTTVASDHDWSTKLHWQDGEEEGEALQLEVTWAIPQGTAAGTYRITYQDGEYQGATAAFQVGDGA